MENKGLTKKLAAGCLFMTMLAASIIANAEPQTLEDTRHLLHRTGFGESPKVVLELNSLSVDALINVVTTNTNPVSNLNPPAWANEPVRHRLPYKNMDETERREARQVVQKLERERYAELQHWWLNSLTSTTNPLRAKMALFWQNHFTSEFRRVRHSQLMYNQLSLINREATGNFASMLRQMVIDPAMLIYLDNRSNRKKKPNENFARELFELFTLGEGNYSEQDIKEAARALTGYTVNHKFESVFRKNNHDNDPKTILGVTANHNVDSLMELLLNNPATAKYIVSKLWRYFISTNPPVDKINALAALFRNANYEIKPLIVAMLETDEFWDINNRATLIRSPADFIVSTLRTAGIDSLDRKILLRSLKGMGQQLFNPPNVKGWQEDKYWITSQTLLARNSFVSMIARNSRQTTKEKVGTMSEPDSRENMMTQSAMADPAMENTMQGPDMTGSMDMQSNSNLGMITPDAENQHLIDASPDLSDTQVRNTMISSTIPAYRTPGKSKSRIGTYILEPGWNLY